MRGSTELVLPGLGQHLPGCGGHQEISQNTTGWPVSDAPRPEDKNTRFIKLSIPPKPALLPRVEAK